MGWGRSLPLPLFLHHTDDLVTSGPGCLPSCRTVGIACPLTRLSASASGAYPFGVHSGLPERPSTLRILQGRSSSSLPPPWCIYLGSHQSLWLEVPTPWPPPCLTDLASPDPRLPPQLPPGFLEVPGAPVRFATAELRPNWNRWERMRSWEGRLVVRAG